VYFFSMAGSSSCVLGAENIGIGNPDGETYASFGWPAGH
jgi:hypothetical protein